MYMPAGPRTLSPDVGSHDRAGDQRHVEGPMRRRRCQPHDPVPGLLASATAGAGGRSVTSRTPCLTVGRAADGYPMLARGGHIHVLVAVHRVSLANDYAQRWKRQGTTYTR